MRITFSKGVNQQSAKEEEKTFPKETKFEFDKSLAACFEGVKISDFKLGFRTSTTYGGNKKIVVEYKKSWGTSYAIISCEDTTDINEYFNEKNKPGRIVL